MTQADLPLPQRKQVARPGATSRTDAWYMQPLVVFLGLMAFVVYSTWAALTGANYLYTGQGADYLSPFFSPLIFDGPGQERSTHSWFGTWPTWWPWFIPATPALFILWAPGGFRFTCYYYRGAYYKSFWGAPPACSVGGPHKGRYTGERKFPLILQNAHRYFLYLAILFLFILSYDAWRAMWFEVGGAEGGEGSEGRQFGMGLGTIVMIINPILLAGYTLGCHSLRHLIGGRKDCVGTSGMKKSYDCVSCLNRHHMKWAWASLIWVGFTDFYIRALSMGLFSDPRLF